MNINSFIQSVKRKIAYCVVDNTNDYRMDWTRELIKNQADFTITNIYSKDYNVFQSQSEDAVLKHVANIGYEYAVVISTGTEFINGDIFFKNVELLISKDFFIAGHVLDRGEAYYELHHQCYILNLKQYIKLGFPKIGRQELGANHIQNIPWRSENNWHDDYTPVAVAGGDMPKKFQHKCHGWHILSVAFDNNLNVLIFDESIRNNKKHFYPENQKEFLKHLAWAYQREAYCSKEFVHTETTDSSNTIAKNIKQVFTPASGLLWLNTIDPVEPVSVVIYDYNQQALDYWRKHVPNIENITYKFVKLDIMNQDIDLPSILDISIPETFINLSNIFAYEGTMFFSGLEYRLTRENTLLSNIKEVMPESFIYFSMRAAMGFADIPSTFIAGEFKPVNFDQLITPTWHSSEWTQ